MHAATEAIGMLASLTSFLLWLPQGARVWKHRADPAQLGGIALSTQVISLVGNVLWGLYAVLIGSFWLGAPSLVNGPIAVATLVVVGRANRSSRAHRPAVVALAPVPAPPGASAPAPPPAPARRAPTPATPAPSPSGPRTAATGIRVADARGLVAA